MHVNILQYSVSRSGTEEDYTELMQLLEDIQQYLQDFTLAKAEEMKSATQKRLLLYIFIERLSSPSTVDLDNDDEVSGSSNKRADQQRYICFCC